jgi:hypothetical protein
METPATLPRPAFRLAGSTLPRIEVLSCPKLAARESGYWRGSALEVDSAKRTAAEPDAIRARTPRIFGDVLGVPAPHRWRCIPLADCVPV